ncbi:MAG: dihydropteroate synthase [Synechococcaceae cyanobacterium SM2_3_1]|nr:dihydropteroate synthase [Synechococcaceae cyanobacterium SM2_3_1]
MKPFSPTLDLTTTSLVWGAKTYVMGIVNVTPDSFSGDGLIGQSDAVAAAVAQAEAQVQAGADLIDIGGESTRPGSQPVPLEAELQRVIPVIQALHGRISVPISIDTYKAEVARVALAAGAEIVNDVWGLRRDPEMASVVASQEAAVIIMHNRSRPQDLEQTPGLGGRYVGVRYEDLIRDIHHELEIGLELAVQAGIPRERIILDPGIGFGKTVEQNIELVDRLGELKALGYPLLVGPSRKSFVGYTLNLPPQDRLGGTAAAVTLCIERGADIVRVHDVGMMQQVARFTDAVVRAQSPNRDSCD